MEDCDSKFAFIIYWYILPQKLPNNVYNLFFTERKEDGKKSLDEQVEPNLNTSEDENQRGKISNSQ